MLRVRVDAWLHPFTTSENITQSLWAFASGGFWGAGLGAGSAAFMRTEFQPSGGTDFYRASTLPDNPTSYRRWLVITESYKMLNPASRT